MASSHASELTKLKNIIREFSAERDWSQFNTPKNLSMALSVEAAELMENFQWLSTGNINELTPVKLQKIKHELADVLIYLICLADKLDTDLHQAVIEKMEINREKYPADKVRGDIRKYSDY